MKWLPVAAAGIVPWTGSTPPARVPPPLAPLCTARSLDASVVLQGETGNLVGSIELVNRGVLACSLAGTPRLRFVGGSNPAGIRARHLRRLTPEPGIPYPSLRALQPGEKAGVFMSWSNWCGPAPRAVRLLLPRLVKTVPIQPAGARPRCDVPAAHAYLASGPLQPLASTSRSHIPLPLTAEIVEHVTSSR
jgi:hypothetical protein